MLRSKIMKERNKKRLIVKYLAVSMISILTLYLMSCEFTEGNKSIIREVNFDKKFSQKKASELSLAFDIDKIKENLITRFPKYKNNMNENIIFIITNNIYPSGIQIDVKYGFEYNSKKVPNSDANKIFSYYNEIIEEKLEAFY
jgi:hypothetical protein